MMDIRTPSDLDEWHAERRDALEHAADADAVDRSENVAGVVALCVIGVVVTIAVALLLM